MHVSHVAYVDVHLHKKFAFLPNKEIITAFIAEEMYLVRQTVCRNCLTWLHCESGNPIRGSPEPTLLGDEEEEEEELEDVEEELSLIHI